MADKFLNTGGSGTGDITNGSINVFAATLAADNLEASLPLKTNSVKQLISTRLDISDINNLQNELDATISTPYVGTISATNFDTAALGPGGKLTTSRVADDTDVSGINMTPTSLDLVATNVLKNGSEIATLADLDGGAISATELVVNPSTGNDGTGVRGDSSKPFLTLAGAIAASSPGDHIICHAGDIAPGPAPTTITYNLTITGVVSNGNPASFCSGIVVFDIGTATGVNITGIGFNSLITPFNNSAASAGNRFFNCTFRDVAFSPTGSFTGGNYFQNCYMNGEWTIRSAFVIFSENSGSSTQKYTVFSGTFLVENHVSTLGNINHFGGTVDLNDIQSFTNTLGGNVGIYSQVDTGVPLTQFLIIRNCYLIDGITNLSLEIAGSVNIGLALYNTNILDGNLTLTGSYTDVAIVSQNNGRINMNSQKITSVADPTDLQDAATKNYVDNAAGGIPIGDYLKRDGTNAMTADLNAGTNKLINVVDPTAAQDGATKNYVDTAVGNVPIGDYLKLDGTSAMTGDLNMGEQNITGLGLVGAPHIARVGTQGLASNIQIGSGNTFNNAVNAISNYSFGHGSMPLLTDGADNIAIGSSCLNTVTTGNANIAIGVGSGNATTGDSNIMLGGQTGVAGISNTISLGYGAIATVNRECVIGTTNAPTSLTHIRPGIDATTDLGTNSIRFNNIYYSGTLNGDSLSNYLPLAGGTMTGDLNIQSSDLNFTGGGINNINLVGGNLNTVRTITTFDALEPITIDSAVGVTLNGNIALTGPSQEVQSVRKITASQALEPIVFDSQSGITIQNAPASGTLTVSSSADLIYRDEASAIDYPVAGPNVKVVRRFDPTADFILFEDANIRIDWIAADLQPSFVLKILPAGLGPFSDWVDCSCNFTGGATTADGNGDGINVLATKCYFYGTTVLNLAFNHVNYGSTTRGIVCAENDSNYPAYSLELITGDVALLGLSIVRVY